jgi:Proliferating cell nuclear antigen, C-terminal domain
MHYLSQVRGDGKLLLPGSQYNSNSLLCFCNETPLTDHFGEDVVVIEATKEGVKFACQGEIGNGSVTVRQHTNVEKPDLDVTIELSEPVALTFSLKYLVNFCKATNLSNKVKLLLSSEVPLQVEYSLGSGFLRFYLAPKVYIPIYWPHGLYEHTLTVFNADRRRRLGYCGVRDIGAFMYQSIKKNLSLILQREQIESR